MATRILQVNNDLSPLGKGWVLKFIKRNSRITSGVGKRIDAKRLVNSQPEMLQRFYDLYEATSDRFKITTENTWNMDEHGIALGVCGNTRVLAEAETKRTYLKAPESREWVTISETILAVGRFIRALVIFRGKYAQSSWFTKEVPDWLYTTSENGWTSNDIGLHWLEEIFLPETSPKDSGHQMFIMDGHGSHPLDLSVFSSMKAHYRGEISELSFIDDAAPVKKSRFISAYEKARKQTLTTRNIRSGWKAAGLVHWNPSKGFQSSQLRLQSPTRPNTPPNPPAQIPVSQNPLLGTPHSARDIYKAMEQLNNEGILNTSQRYFFRKISKVISQLNAEQALLQASNYKLTTQLESLRDSTARKRVDLLQGAKLNMQKLRDLLGAKITENADFVD